MDSLYDMDDLPESMRMRMRRQTSFQQDSAREASEDGDFVTLKNVRKKFQQERVRGSKISPVKELDEEEEEEILSPVKVFSSRNQHQSVEDQHLERVRVKLFDAAASGSMSVIAETMAGFGAEMHDLRDPQTGMNVLHHALHLQRLDVAEYLIERGTIELVTQEYLLKKGTRSALHQITELGNISLAKQLLSKFRSAEEKLKIIKKITEVEIAGQRPRTFSSFHLAAFKGFTNLVNLYLDEGIDIDLVNVKKDTALLWAARWGHDDTVNCLLNRKPPANVDIENDKRSTALHWAVRYEFASTVKLLLEKGRANPNHERLIGLVTPLVMASAYGNNEIVKLLLKNKAKTNHVIRGGEVAMHHAAKEGHLDVVKTLLAYGADINIEDEKGDIALNLAASNGHSEVVKYLIRHGSDISHKNHTGHDVWYHALNSEDNGVLKELTEHYNQLKANNDSIRLKSPISIAASLGKPKKIKRLIKLGVDPTETDSNGNTFLHHAAIHNQHKVIKKYYKSCDIDAQNDKKETPLHIACAHGHLEAAVELMANKAKSNIGNLNGENALHVTALSTKTTPKLARAVVEHTIKSHDWESVNSTDNYGNNALHLAGKFATPDVLWEFRFVRFKDTDVDGNTPLHEAVRLDDPEALETVLDIYEMMQRDADINTPNNNSETVLHLAASAGFAESVTRLIFYGSDLACADAKGNTVLHRLVKLTVKDESKGRVYMNVVDTILHDSVRWWCKKKQLIYPGDDLKEFTKIQRIAVNTLLGDYQNNGNLSVIAYAFKIGADHFLARVLTMSNVTEFRRGQTVYYDVSHMTPTTNDARQPGTGNKSTHMPSYTELLVSVTSERAKERSSHVLDIPPVRQIERMYTSICAWAYAFFLILHIVYMSGFTYLGIHIASQFRGNNGTELSNTDPHWIAAYLIVPIEPVIFLAYFFVRLCRSIARSDWTFLMQDIFTICFNMLYCVLAIAWLILIATKDANEDYVLSVTLCLGWLYSISFTRGFKRVHYFYRMLLNMIVRDVLRFLIVFAFVLLAFSFALHVIFQISATVVNIYPSAGDTIFLVFNLMIGMAELFDSDFEAGMSSVGRSAIYAKIVYLFYIILSTVVLLNLLIAMMNDSYSDILTNQKVTWRVDSVKIGVGVENLFPWFPSVFSRVKIEKIQLHNFSDDEAPAATKWYLVTTEKEIEQYSPNQSKMEGIESMLESRLGEVEKRMKDAEMNTKVTMEKFDAIMKILDDLQKSNTRI